MHIGNMTKSWQLYRGCTNPRRYRKATVYQQFKTMCNVPSLQKQIRLKFYYYVKT